MIFKFKVFNQKSEVVVVYWCTVCNEGVACDL